MIPHATYPRRCEAPLFFSSRDDSPRYPLCTSRRLADCPRARHSSTSNPGWHYLTRQSTISASITLGLEVCAHTRAEAARGRRRLLAITERALMRQVEKAPHAALVSATSVSP